MSIDLNFRPASYTDFDDPVDLALNGISGQMRRGMVRDGGRWVSTTPADRDSGMSPHGDGAAVLETTVAPRTGPAVST